MLAPSCIPSWGAQHRSACNSLCCRTCRPAPQDRNNQKIQSSNIYLDQGQIDVSDTYYIQPTPIHWFCQMYTCHHLPQASCMQTNRMVVQEEFIPLPPRNRIRSNQQMSSHQFESSWGLSLAAIGLSRANSSLPAWLSVDCHCNLRRENWENIGS